MAKDSARMYAVLTGDIIASGRMQHVDLERTKGRLQWCCRDLEQQYPGLIRGKIDFFRGDAWQVLIERPELALRTALYLRVGLIAFESSDTRLAIGIGEIDTIVEDRISQSTGSAFTLSGHALDELGSKNRLGIALPSRFGEIQDWLALNLRLCHALLRRLKAKQAQALMGALKDLTQNDIAKQHEPPITQQAVAKALSGCDWYAIEAVLVHFENVFSTI